MPLSASFTLHSVHRSDVVGADETELTGWGDNAGLARMMCFIETRTGIGYDIIAEMLHRDY